MSVQSVNKLIDEEKFSLSQVTTVTAKRLRSPPGIQQLILDPTRKVLGWSKWYYGALSQPAQKVNRLFGHAHRMLFWFNFPTSLKNLSRSLKEFKESLFSASTLQITKKTSWVFIRSSEVAGLVSSGFDIAYKEGLVSLSQFSLTIIEAIGFLGSAALFLSSLVGIYKNIRKIEEAEYMSPKFNLAFARVITNTLLAAMAVFGMFTFVIGSGLVAQWVFLSVSTAFLLLSIWTYFYNEMVVEPSEKTLELKA